MTTGGAVMRFLRGYAPLFLATILHMLAMFTVAWVFRIVDQQAYQEPRATQFRLTLVATGITGGLVGFVLVWRIKRPVLERALVFLIIAFVDFFFYVIPCALSMSPGLF